MKRHPKTIGYHPCGRNGCDETADTRQMIKGQNYYLYSVCPACKMDQSTGAIHQTYLWNHTEWIDQAPEEAPPNLIEATAKPAAEVVTETVEEEPGLFDPEAQTQAQAAEESKAEGQKVPMVVKIGLGALALGLTALGVKGAMANMQVMK